MNSFTLWLEDCCESGNEPTPFRLLWSSYNEWLRTQPHSVQTSAAIESMKAFGQELQKEGYEPGFERIAGRQQRVYYKIRILN
jgi:hypothetical protein